MDAENGISMDHHGRTTAFSRPKYDRPSAHQEALNMSTFAESRSQSVPLNYRQSPVQLSSDGASWSSSYQNTNNAPSSACSSVAQTPIPADYNDFTEMMNIWENEPVMPPATSSAETGAPSSGVIANGQETGEKYKDRNNNSSAEEFMDEIKAFAGANANSITSRSVPSTPLPTATASYYPKAYYNNSSSGHSNGLGMFSNYGEQGRCYDASKSVPTTPIASVSSSHFRYSPIVDVLNRSRDSLINGNIILDKELGAGTSAAFGFTDVQNNINAGDVEGATGLALGVGGGGSARRRIERIEEDRKMASSQGGLMGDKEMSPLDEEMGFDMDTDLMNQFKGEF